MLPLEQIMGPKITPVPGKDALVVAISGKKHHNSILLQIVDILREYGYSSSQVVEKENAIGVLFERTKAINLKQFELPPHIRNRELKR